MEQELKFKKGDIVYDVNTHKSGFVGNVFYDEDEYPDWKIQVVKDDFTSFFQYQNKLQKCYPDK